ncbi:hypothetical protein Amsp01_074860 [Amycolatopsis sp. NBRC 101858]|uniref:hypothetical protein n=1 Tax=Amycolatopsis sp. NBRC 101858 TaxID=3032200 RepID=UPI0024A11219|nr:hypothetical protein [Amycolatopsis sp. NBRC 101858]GLY41463.1 hypothetical protein Amsp01_074860 [Amycolatopsis sp. NBRC 101858]
MPVPEFSLLLPDGFLTLPARELDETGFRALAAAVADRFGLDGEIDQGLAETTVMLATTAAAARAGGSGHTSAGFFRSPDDPDRPIMVLVSCFFLESGHPSAAVVITGLRQVHEATASGPVNVVELPVGPAVVVQSVTHSQIPAGAGTVRITQHGITAWIPGPDGLVGLAVTSNNTEDWAHVAELAHGIFETFAWAGAGSQE